jgi:hypothetical protein
MDGRRRAASLWIGMLDVNFMIDKKQKMQDILY